MTYYIMADLRRQGKGTEPNNMYAGKVKAVIDAETWPEAMEIGKRLIGGSLRDSVTAIQWTWMPADSARELGDEEIYDQIPTASWLTYYRKAADMTQKALAEAAGVNIRQIQKIEAGDIQIENVTLGNALRLAGALSVPVEALIHGES